MKLILSGANGFIGTEILNQTLSNPAITSLIALSRKPLSITHPKLRVVIVQDFSSYTPEILEELEGAEGCIWFVLPLSLPFFSYLPCCLIYCLQWLRKREDWEKRTKTMK